jgi:5-methylcytosine-specific restriction endonuclease McrA
MARIPQVLRQAVLDAAQGRCASCLNPEQMMGVTFEVDHIIARSAGCHTRLDNLCLSCPTCNRHNARRYTAREPLSGRLVRLFHPKQDLWSHHFAWNAHGTHIIGLTPTGRATVEALCFNSPTLDDLRCDE